MFTRGSLHPDADALESLCDRLRHLAPRAAVDGPWRSGSLRELASAGALAGFVGEADGGTAAAEPALVELLVAVAQECLTTALVLSQWAGGVRLIAMAPPELRTRLLPELARGETFTTVGISQLTTSRRHLAGPALTAGRESDGGWRLDGVCPWVTGADSCDTIVVGGASADGGQAFFVVPTAAPGLVIEPPLELLALSGSRTARVRFEGVPVPDAILPTEGAPRAGGLATTALALGAARAAIAHLVEEAGTRPPLRPAAAGLAAEADDIRIRLTEAAREGLEPTARDALRAEATGLVVRAAQAALTAAKGEGFVVGHPAERRVREAHFFLVWSCPQAVSSAVLCELAGIGG